ncbi:hypothetical protein AVEN_215401-1 [Araneus ventricosus]|uniref:Transposase Tc1-like domain-containing protein n=1 Tax=Araneus ventricosus TaxID=182803 RepID=A0A4Y2GMR6_ARAVE|nr:hypothetical protein AVEN_215401-1 [Araneus ventricosus]
MPLRRRRSHYQQLTEFERGRVVGLREGGFSFRDIAERLARNVSTVHDCWQQWSREGTDSRRLGSERPRGNTEREDRRVRRMAVAHRTASAAEIRAAVGTTVIQRTVANRLHQGQLRARRPVACIPLIPNHCRLRREWCLAIAHWRTEWRVCFLMKVGSALVPVVAVCWLEGSQRAISYVSRSTLVVIPSTVTANLYVSLVIQPVALSFKNRIQGGVFQQDIARPHTAVVTQHALQSVVRLPWPARSPDLSPIEHVWVIIGRQLQRHPQPALTVPVLNDQVQQAWNSIPQTDIRHLYDTMHARLHAYIQNSGGYTGY